ncbi:hypothetical protein ACGFZU_42735 [Streptomyces tendae]|uniref:hypothetical protein n=1 Tax=Streptomyces tendae TaxID=1932 RepID=UPI0037248F02
MVHCASIRNAAPPRLSRWAYGTDHADRGAFGIALAVPDSNTWYRGTVLPSPDKPVPDKKEQRPMLCAVVPDEGSAYCNAHFSSGPYINSAGKLVGDDSDPNNLFRPKQAAEMRSQVGDYTAAGYTTYYGGDLNTTTADVTYLDPLYSSGQECGQSDPSKPHTGNPTDGNNKIDYVFGPRGLTDLGVIASGLVRPGDRARLGW